VKKKQDKRHLQDGHCGLACELRDETSISFSTGIALPKWGTARLPCPANA
jgi:hypothetical protein